MNNNSTYKTLITVLSIAIPLVVAFLLQLPQTGKFGDVDFSVLPHLNGILNFLTSLALLFGLYFVKNGNIKNHRISMFVAFTLSSLFLVSYVLYHFQMPSTKFGGDGVLKMIYFFLLITHIVLAIVVVPLVLNAIFFGVTNQIDKHKKIVKYSYPVWLYVSISGVLVYLLISPYYA